MSPAPWLPRQQSSAGSLMQSRYRWSGIPAREGVCSALENDNEVSAPRLILRCRHLKSQVFVVADWRSIPEFTRIGVFAIHVRNLMLKAVHLEHPQPPTWPKHRDVNSS